MSKYKEILHIRNFGGIKDAEIELSRLNVFIGPQGTGKSVAAKLIYFFRQIVRTIGSDLASIASARATKLRHHTVFGEFFPPESWPDDEFQVSYEFGEVKVGVTHYPNRTSDVIYEYSPYFDELSEVANEATRIATSEQRQIPSVAARSAIALKVSRDIDPVLGRLSYFVPEARGYISAEDLLALVRDSREVDPFMREFVTVYGPTRKRAEAILFNYEHRKRVSDIVQGDISSNGDNLFVVAADGRRVPIDLGSSGQRAALPLILILLQNSQASMSNTDGTVFIEEPEAHLYPTGQREFTRILADVSRLNLPDCLPQYVITTHSPYLLTAFNNLMYAGRIVRDKPKLKTQVDSILGGTPVIDPRNVRAYAFEGGAVRSIIEADTELIHSGELDSVSDDLGREFDKLLDLAYAEDAA